MTTLHHSHSVSNLLLYASAHPLPPVTQYHQPAEVVISNRDILFKEADILRRDRRPQPLDLSSLSTYSVTPQPASSKDLYINYWDEDALAVDALPLPDYLLEHHAVQPAKVGDSEPEELIFEKRGGKGVNRHLLAASFSAAVAASTAGISLMANSLKAHDQDKYGVSRKANLSDGGGKGGKEKGKEKEQARDKPGGDKGDEDDSDDDDDDDDSGATFITNITNITNRIYINQPTTSSDHEKPRDGDHDERHSREEGEKREERDEEEDFYKRAGGIAKPSRLAKYDHWAPLLEKVEDYGKVTAAIGASGAAIVMFYAAARAHLSYKKKEEENEKEDKKERSKKLKEKEDDDDKKHTRDLWDDADEQDSVALVPSLLPTWTR